MAETLTPQDLSAEGASAYAAKRYEEAAAAFERAALAFHATGDEVNAAEAANNASVASLLAGNPKKALQLADGTDQVFLSRGDVHRQGIALANQAAALEALNRLKEALERYKSASDLLKQSGDKEKRAMVLGIISSLQLRTGNQLQALASMDAALDQKKKLSLKERLLQKLLKVPFDFMNRK